MAVVDGFARILDGLATAAAHASLHHEIARFTARQAQIASQKMIEAGHGLAEIL